MRLTLAFAALAALAAASAPSFAAEERILTIFGKDKCPENTICVRASEAERYRIPKDLRQRPQTPDSVSWASRSQATLSEGKSGAESCSSVGAGGWTGCWAEQMRKARAESKAAKASGADVP